MYIHNKIFRLITILIERNLDSHNKYGKKNNLNANMMKNTFSYKFYLEIYCNYLKVLKFGKRAIRPTQIVLNKFEKGGSRKAIKLKERIKKLKIFQKIIL